MFKINDVVVDRIGQVYQVVGLFHNDRLGNQVLCRKYRSQKRVGFLPWQIKKHSFFA